ncbi:unnamed protein product [Meloidogyne enterolobii]|uniref:Uncharacterized protein n=2 Tax=Meloidogyne enterolobii TaxID=390850 RepID=A0ACB1B952_MELEN
MSSRCLLFKNIRSSPDSLYPSRKLILAINLLLSFSYLPNQVFMKISKFPPTDQKSLTQTSPIPICSSDSIGILILNPEVMSDLPFIIYANGYEEEPECLQPFPPRSPLLRLEIQLKFGFPCGVNKRRMVFPRVGLEYSLRVLLNHIDENEFQVHMNRINGFRKLPKIQQNQRIFDIHCQYFSDINQTIGQVLEISIHSNSVNGPVAEKVRLGDRVFHRWRCDDKYALKVYQCYATDGRNREHQIINDQGWIMF